jgi:hypothetical protein
MSTQALEQSASSSTTMPLPAPGRYLAENGRWFVQLRIEAGRDADISADLQSRDEVSAVDLWTKTRIHTDSTEADGALRRESDWLDAHGGRASGTIEVRPIDDHQLDATFTINQALAGLVPGFQLTVRAARISSALRDVGLEIDWEAGQKFELAAPFQQKIIEVKTVLHEAGLDVHNVGQETVIPSPVGGTWSASDIFTALNEQLRRSSQAPLTSPAWELHLLLLSKTDRPGLLGVMFDFADNLPRQGAAVFVQEIRDRFGDVEVTHRVITTAIHELGHCLNLTHRFSREVGRADSTSPMNYDWLFEGGNHADAYWKQFSYTFDRDELEFLRHAPRDQIIPGGAPFGSVRYWATPDLGRLPEQNLVRGLQLWLTPPPTGLHFAYGQPIFLEVSLRNVSKNRWCLPRHALDVKAATLEILIRRRRQTPNWNTTAEREPFLPFMRRCFDVDAADKIALRPGESLHDNLNLTFGSAGSPFAEPGDYVITPVLTLYDEQLEGIAGVVEGGELMITVEPPVSGLEKRDAELVGRADVGASLALGGADCLSDAAEELRGVVERRQHDRALRDGPDGLTAAGMRMLGIAANRRGDRREARALLTAVTESPLLATFDPHTALHTRLLASRQDAPRPRDTTIYVDIATRTALRGTRTSGPLSGVLLSRRHDQRRPGPPADGVAVLLDASSFVGDEVVSASAVISASDGVTERVSINSLEIFHDDSSARPLALAPLSRTVPSSAPTPLTLDGLWTADTMEQVQTILARGEVPLSVDDRDRGMPAELAPVVSAERGAPWALPVAATGDQVPTYEHNVGDVASWICYFTNRCNEAPPGHDRSLPKDEEKKLPEPGCRQPTGTAGQSLVSSEAV